jgi:hypothetical protein
LLTVYLQLPPDPPQLQPGNDDVYTCPEQFVENTTINVINTMTTVINAINDDAQHLPKRFPILINSYFLF